jgi:hypothetical protein
LYNDLLESLEAVDAALTTRQVVTAWTAFSSLVTVWLQALPEDTMAASVKTRVDALEYATFFPDDAVPAVHQPVAETVPHPLPPGAQDSLAWLLGDDPHEIAPNQTYVRCTNPVASNVHYYDAGGYARFCDESRRQRIQPCTLCPLCRNAMDSTAYINTSSP